MKKVELSIEETLKFQRKMTIEIPDEMTEDELNKVLDKAQRQSYAAGDIPYAIENISNQVNVVSHPDESCNNPWHSEVEIDDFQYMD